MGQNLMHHSAGDLVGKYAPFRKYRAAGVSIRQPAQKK
jgi:hypothetical protein